PKPFFVILQHCDSFRAVLFRMVPKQRLNKEFDNDRFRAVLFRMVPKLVIHLLIHQHCFRAVLFRMVPKQS
ncbi:hypothetical protein, partial [Streptococcus agalactiae]|uniref:hypothetical protein n=1 Tax=Streptococcus agalactiae TaxID=1311 RepID=UPI003FA78866